MAQFPAPNQIAARARHAPSAIPTCGPLPDGVGRRTLAGTRAAVRTVIRYRNGVLNGKGASLLDGYMEDLATDRIYRLMIAQRMRHRDACSVPDGRGSAGRAHAGVGAPAASTRNWRACCAELPRGRDAGNGRTLPRGAAASEAMIRNGWFDPACDRAARDGICSPTRRTPMIATRRSHDTRSADAGRTDPRWQGVERALRAPRTCVRLRGSVRSRAHAGARWARSGCGRCCTTRPYVRALGALTGNQAVQQVAAGLQGDLLSAAGRSRPTPTPPGRCIPTRASTPSTAVPQLVRRINDALQRADQIAHRRGPQRTRYWFAPIVADAEAGFGGDLNAFELMKAMIEAGAAGVHFEDQLASAKKCGHMGGKVLVPTREFVQKLVAARLAADVMDVPTLIIARTDANSAKLLTSDVDERDHAFLTGRAHAGRLLRHQGRPRRGHRPRPRLRAVRRPDLVRDLDARPRRGAALRRGHPRALSPASCSPTTARPRSTGRRSWTRRPSRGSSANWGRWATRSSSSRWPGFHALNLSMFELARGYRERGMTAYAELQEREFAAAEGARLRGGEAPALRRHRLLRRGGADHRRRRFATTALSGSTEEEQFSEAQRAPEAPRAGDQPGYRMRGRE